MTEPTDAEIIALADETRTAEGGASGYILPISFARAVLAKWGTPPVPAGYALVPVNPTPEMWKAAKSVPDPNPPYPPHYGLVWDAMLAASPTPPAEQPIDEVVVTKDEDGQIVAVTRQDDEGHILSVIATCDPAEQQAPVQVSTQWLAEMIMSDCGCSTQNQRLIDRIIERITQYESANTTPQPAPATQQAGDVVAYLDVGASGYLDLGSALSDEALQQLPKGRHALVIAGTYGIDGYVAAPQPSPMAQAADSVLEDAARWQTFIALPYATRAEWASNLSLAPVLTQWVDAARKQGANHD